MNETIDWDDIEPGDRIVCGRVTGTFCTKGNGVNGGDEGGCLRDATELLPSGSTKPTNGGSCCEAEEEGHWWISPSNHYVLLSKKGNTMNKITRAMGRTFTEDDQTLYKAGFIDEKGEITEVGRYVMLDILWLANKKAILDEARSQIDEELMSK